MSARDFAKFNDRRDWPAPEPERLGRSGPRSLEALARRRARKADRRDDNGSPTAPPAEAPHPPDFNVRTPDGCCWDGNGRYCRWNLPTHNGRPALGPDADFQKIMSGQRDRIMQQGDGEGKQLTCR
jgi:hypothetical protein